MQDPTFTDEIDASWQERRDSEYLTNLVRRYREAEDELAELAVAADAQRYDTKYGSRLRDRLFAAIADDYLTVAA
jgi:hypothetical protein